MKALFLGDVVGTPGIDIIEKKLPRLISKYNADFVLVNGENANCHNGITQNEAERIHYAGADVITGGNHTLAQKSIYNFLDDCTYMLRPINYPSIAPGHGYTITDTPIGKILTINLSGKVYMENTDNPFTAIDIVLKNTTADYIFIDFHAEATSEKKAMGCYVDGRVSGIFGTHTHVQTADEHFLPKGTAYITDLGMCGVQESALGIEYDCVIKKFVAGLPAGFVKATGNASINGLFLNTDKKILQRINE